MDDDVSSVLFGIIVVMLFVFGMIVVIVFSSDNNEERLIYQGPEGHCMADDDTAICYDLRNKEVCRYEYNMYENGSWCNH